MLVSPAEPPPLNAMGTVSSLPEKWGSDFAWAHNGKLVGVQRKEFHDLLGSTGSNDRLARESQQIAFCHIAILIIEGKPHWTTDGHLSDRYYHRWTKSAYRRLLMSIMARGIWVFHTESVEDTMQLLADLEQWTAKDNHLALSRRPGPQAAWGSPGSRDWKLWALGGFPGIGPELAERILDHFGGGLPLKWTGSQEDFAQIKGLGPKRIATLFSLLGQQDSSTEKDASP